MEPFFKKGFLVETHPPVTLINHILASKNSILPVSWRGTPKGLPRPVSSFQIRTGNNFRELVSSPAL